jgi:hypothetical protein
MLVTQVLCNEPEAESQSQSMEEGAEVGAEVAVEVVVCPIHQSLLLFVNRVSVADGRIQ